MSAGPKIVSLLPSATEIVCALGFGAHLVGRSHECDFPADITSLPVCTAPRFDAGGSSREIDARVKNLSAHEGGLYAVDRDRLAQLAPDVVVTQTQCEVCAVNVREVEAAVRETLGDGTRIVTLEAESVHGIYEDIRRVAEALDAGAAGETLVADMRRRFESTANRARQGSEYPGTVCLEWLEPLMTAGNWVPELVEAAGGHSLLADRSEPSRWIRWEDIEAARPAVLLLIPCGFDIERTLSELPLLRDRPGWSALPAVRDRRVYVAEGNALFNRPGPRIVESLEVLAEILHPERIPPRHEATAWRRV